MNMQKSKDDKARLSLFILVIAVGCMVVGGIGYTTSLNTDRVTASVSTTAVPEEELYNTTTVNIEYNYMASVNGEVYYPINCTVGERIHKENRVYYTSIEEAIRDRKRASKQC